MQGDPNDLREIARKVRSGGAFFSSSSAADPTNIDGLHDKATPPYATDLWRFLREIRLATALAGAVAMIGVVVMLGWTLHLPALTRIVPGFTSMVLNTALSFALLGQALMCTAAPTPAKAQGRLLAAIVLLLSVLNLVQIGSGISLGINLAPFHAWMHDGNPIPGQMSTPTSVAFVLSALGFIAIHSDWVRSPQGRFVGRAACVIVFCIASVAIVGYLLRLEALYSWYAFSRMALHTAVSMMLLSTALWARQNEIDGRGVASDEERIVTLGTATVTLIAVLSGLSGLMILKQETDRQLAEAIRLTHAARIDVVDTTLDLRATRGALVAAESSLRRLLLSEAGATDPDSAVEADRTLGSLLSYGFNSVQVVSPDGRVLASSGRAHDTVAAAVSIRNALQGTTMLAWRQGFFLKQATEVHDGGQTVGSIVTEQPLPTLDRLLADPSQDDRSITQLCGESAHGPICFSDRRHPNPYDAPQAGTPDAVGIEFARSGRTGVDSFRDTRGNLKTLAFAPVGLTGLVALTSPDKQQFFAPLRERLSMGFLLVAVVTAIGLLILRASIRPLTQRLVHTERRHRAVLNCLQEGVLLQDRHSAVLASNPAAERVLGLTQAELVSVAAGDPRWKLLREDGSVCPVSDYPAPRALREGRGRSDELFGLLDPDGRLRWLEVSTTALSESGEPAAVVTFAEVTSRISAQQRLQESEARFRLMIDQVVDYAILMLDADGKVATWNHGAQRIKGYTATEIIGTHFSCFFTQEDREAGKPEEELRAAAFDGHGEYEGWRLRKDGSRFWGVVVLTALRNKEGHLLGFTKVTRDLSERYRADLLVAESNRRVQAMIDSSPFGIVATDLQGVILNINPAGEKMVGYTRAELVGKLTPAVYHDPAQIITRAHELSEETGRTITPGLESFVYKARLGLTDEREWTCIRKDGTRFPMQLAITPLHDPDRAIVGFMGIAYDITERKRREDYTQHIAHHDALTGLPTRRLLEDRVHVALQQAHRAGSEVGLLMIDLDRFKRVNDSLGHHVGDELLKEVATRLKTSIRACDTVARMGGDEFVIVLPDVNSISIAERVAAQVVQCVSAPIHVAGHVLHVTLSVGIALYPAHAADSGTLLRHADAAMYAAKQAGRSCFRVFSRQLQSEADERIRLETDLRRALLDDQLQIHYQPQVDLETGDVIGMEALLRWTHPERGPISPAVFIPIAEESGLIVEIGERVFRTACKGARELQIQTGTPLRLAVNLSPRQFRSNALITVISDALKESGLDPRHLEVEITEGVLMEDADEAIRRLSAIRGLGVAIAVDDFGTGYSSLAYITRFPIDTLKIDKSFISRLPDHHGDAAVAQAIIALSMSLGFKVVAEGVENTAQLAFLRERQCDTAQGFLLGRPVPKERFSVQGFHFGKAVTERNFAETFEGVQRDSRALVHAIH